MDQSDRLDHLGQEGLSALPDHELLRVAGSFDLDSPSLAWLVASGVLTPERAAELRAEAERK